MKWTTLLAYSLLVSTSASAQDRPSAVSEEEADTFKLMFEGVEGAANAKRILAWNKMKAQVLGDNANSDNRAVGWVQPSNKKESCKTFQSMEPTAEQTPPWKNRTNKYYWDGECKNGFAFGLGREFQVVDGELSSALADYKEANTAPRYYLETHYDRGVVRFLNRTPTLLASTTYSVSHKQAKDTIYVQVSLLDATENRLYSDGIQIGMDKAIGYTTLPNQNKYVFIRDSSPSNGGFVIGTVTAEDEKAGYNIVYQDNGITQRLRHLHYTTNTAFIEVEMPAAYRAHLFEVRDRLDKKMQTASSMLEASHIAINRYKRRICNGDVKVDFVDTVTYGQICLEGGELSRFAKTIDKANEEKRARYQAATETIAQQKSQILLQQQQLQDYEAGNQARRAQQQQLQQQGAQAQARANSENSNAMIQATNDFARSMEDLHRRSSQFTQSYMNTNPSPGVQFGSPGSTGNKVMNCFNLSSIITCR